jgi:hypothetical protein
LLSSFKIRTAAASDASGLMTRSMISSGLQREEAALPAASIRSTSAHFSGSTSYAAAQAPNRSHFNRAGLKAHLKAWWLAQREPVAFANHLVAFASNHPAKRTTTIPSSVAPLPLSGYKWKRLSIKCMLTSFRKE